MKIHNTSIVCTPTASIAINDMIEECYNSRTITMFKELLTINGNIGMVVEVDKDHTMTTTTTHYFIVTLIGDTMSRVEYCTNSNTTYNDLVVETLMKSI